MPMFLFVFGYETADQVRRNDANGWNDEDSKAVFIRAETAAAALEWGTEIAEAFLARLHCDPSVSWRARSYANWIESDPEDRYDAVTLAAIPVVAYGEYPDWAAASSTKETTMVVNRSAPRATVVPILVYEDVAKAIDWLCGTFGFKERLRAAGPGGNVSHAQLDIAEGAVMLGRQGAEFRPPRSNEVNQYVVVHVEDVDGHFEHARQCGARILQSPADMPFGERQYSVQDVGGHRWTFSQSIADVAPEEWGATPARPQ